MCVCTLHTLSVGSQLRSMVKSNLDLAVLPHPQAAQHGFSAAEWFAVIRTYIHTYIRTFVGT